MTARVTITVGCPGSGKTTWARSLDPVDNLVLSLDDFRVAMFGSKQEYWDKVVPVHGNEIRGLVWQCYAAALDRVLTAGWPGHVVLCNTALEFKNIERDLPILHKNGITPTLRIWDLSLLELHERNRNRPAVEHISPDYVERCYAAMFRSDAWWRHSDLPKEFAE